MKTPESADCPEFLENLDRLMNGQMSSVEEEEFLSAIGSNIHCVNTLEMEQAYKEFLAKKLERKCCTQALIDTIQKKCIRNEEE